MDNLINTMCMDALLEGDSILFVNVEGEILSYDLKKNIMSYKGQILQNEVVLIRRIFKIKEKYYFVSNDFCQIYEYVNGNKFSTKVFSSQVKNTRTKDAFFCNDKIVCFPVDFSQEIISFDIKSGKGESLTELSKKIAQIQLCNKQLYSISKKNNNLFLAMTSSGDLYKCDLEKYTLELCANLEEGIYGICCTDDHIWLKGDNTIFLYGEEKISEFELDQDIESLVKLIYYNRVFVAIPVYGKSIGLVKGQNNCKILEYPFGLQETECTFSIGYALWDHKIVMMPWRIKNIVIIDLKKEVLEKVNPRIDDSLDRYVFNKKLRNSNCCLCENENTNLKNLLGYIVDM